jgi:hypothetical protein
MTVALTKAMVYKTNVAHTANNSKLDHVPSSGMVLIIVANLLLASTEPTDATIVIAIMATETLEHPVVVRLIGSMAMSIQKRVGSKGFVCMSPRFFSVGTFKMLISLERTRSWIQRQRVSRCRTLPVPKRAVMPLAAVLSVPTLALTVKPQSSKRFFVQSTRAAPLQTPYSSASPEDRAMLC